MPSNVCRSIISRATDMSNPLHETEYTNLVFLLMGCFMGVMSKKVSPEEKLAELGELRDAMAALHSRSRHDEAKAARGRTN